MHALELKIPPPLVALTTAALMWLVVRWTPGFTFAMPMHRVFAACLAIAGVACAVLGVWSFRRAQTTVNPMHPEQASSLVTCGIYTITRNPMYLGLALVLLGWAVFLANVLALVFVPAFMLYMNRFQIGPEEAALSAAFREAFVAYRSRVRRWL